MLTKEQANFLLELLDENEFRLSAMGAYIDWDFHSDLRVAIERTQDEP